MSQAIEFIRAGESMVVARGRQRLALGLNWAHGDISAQKNRRTLARYVHGQHSAEYLAWFQNKRDKSLPESFYAWSQDDEAALNNTLPALGYLARRHYEAGEDDVLALERIKDNVFWLGRILGGIPDLDIIIDNTTEIAKQVEKARAEGLVLTGSGVGRFVKGEDKEAIFLPLLAGLKKTRAGVRLRPVRNNALLNSALTLLILGGAYYFYAGSPIESQPDEAALRAEAEQAWQQAVKTDLLPAPPLAHLSVIAATLTQAPTYVGRFELQKIICDLRACRFAWQKPAGHGTSLASFVEAGAVEALAELDIDNAQNRYQFQYALDESLPAYKGTSNLEFPDALSVNRACNRVNQLLFFQIRCVFTAAQPVDIPNSDYLDASLLYKKGSIILDYPLFLSDEVLRLFQGDGFSSATVELTPANIGFIARHQFNFFIR